MSANDSEHAQRRGPFRRRLDRQASGRPSSATLEAPARGVAVLPDDQRERVWTLHLRGHSQRQIAVKLDLHRDTVARLLRECYAEFGKERRARLRRKLDAAVARMQHIQQQAWTDHDADDERERSVLEAAVPGTRYQSQRSQYLRLALDAEKEIARLEGLYADDVSDLAAVLFSVERVVGGVVVKRQGQAAPSVEEVSDA